MKAIPFESNILIAPDKPEDFTPGGLEIPQIAKDRLQREAVLGEILAVGPGVICYVWDEGEKVKPKPGDRVLFSKYGGCEVTLDGVKYRMVRDEDLIAKIKDE